MMLRCDAMQGQAIKRHPPQADLGWKTNAESQKKHMVFKKQTVVSNSANQHSLRRWSNMRLPAGPTPRSTNLAMDRVVWLM